MPTNWPTSLDTFPVNVDSVDDVLAADMNNVQDAVAALETELGTGGLKGTTASLTARLNVGLNADGTIAAAALPNPIPANYVQTTSIQNLAVTNAKINDVNGSKIVAASIPSGKHAAGSILTADIGAGQITGTLLATDAVTTGKVSDEAITALKQELGLRGRHETVWDIAAAGTATVRALASASAGTYTTSITNPDVPRIASASLKNISGGALTNVAENFVVTGVDARGIALVETIIIPAQSVGAGGTVTVLGLKPFATITSIQLVNGNDANWQFSIGTGDKIGLANNVASGYKVRKNGLDVTPLPTFSATNHTVDLATITALDEFDIWYKTA